MLRVRSIMRQPIGDEAVDGEIEADATLEQVIAASQGDLTRHYRVIEDGRPVGTLDMPSLVRALVPR